MLLQTMSVGVETALSVARAPSHFWNRFSRQGLRTPSSPPVSGALNGHMSIIGQLVKSTHSSASVFPLMMVTVVVRSFPPLLRLNAPSFRKTTQHPTFLQHPPPPLSRSWAICKLLEFPCVQAWKNVWKGLFSFPAPANAKKHPLPPGAFFP